MKLSKISTLFGAGILALGLATLPASAQSGTTGGTTTPGGDTTVNPTTTDSTNTTGTTAGTDYRSDDGFDWGWLGLIGLAGLAGLKGKDRDERVTYRDPVNRETTFRE